jgi:hypothetical protein
MMTPETGKGGRQHTTKEEQNSTAQRSTFSGIYRFLSSV